MEARGGPSLYGPPPLLHCRNNGLCKICHGGSMKARGGPCLYGPPPLLHRKNNGFCNISDAMEAPWRLGEARLCTGLHSFCVVKTMDSATSHMPRRLPMEARGGPSLYGPPLFLHFKNNGFCNISYAMEARWRLGEACLCTGFHSFCIVKPMVFATFHMPWRLHGGSGRPVSLRASTSFAL